MIEGVSSSTLVTLSDLVTIQAGYPFRGPYAIFLVVQ